LTRLWTRFVEETDLVIRKESRSAIPISGTIQSHFGIQISAHLLRSIAVALSSAMSAPLGLYVRAVSPRRHAMSYKPRSRGNPATESSLAQVLAAVQDAVPNERRREEIASARRTVARALGKRLESIPADLCRLSARLKEVAPRAIGISQRRWNNVRRALLRAGPIEVQPMSPGQQHNKLSADWARLWQQLPLRRLRMKCPGTCDFARYLSSNPRRSRKRHSPPIGLISMIAY
jgi:hypothetical protein